MNVNKQSSLITPKQREDLIYRRQMLMSEIMVEIPDINNKGAIKICMHEISKVACRLFLEFMGIGFDSEKYKKDGIFDIKEARNKKYKDDFRITDLGGDWVNINKLSKKERELLAKVILTADKSGVHYTHGGKYGGDSEVVSPGRELIDTLLKKHLYKKLNIKVEPF